MAVHDLILSAALDHPLIATAAPLILLIVARLVYRLYLHPIAHIPGPLLPKLTSLWLYYHAYIGDEASVIHRLHAQYGPLVRVAPNEVDISDADAIHPIPGAPPRGA